MFIFLIQGEKFQVLSLFFHFSILSCFLWIISKVMTLARLHYVLLVYICPLLKILNLSKNISRYNFTIIFNRFTFNSLSYFASSKLTKNILNCIGSASLKLFRLIEQPSYIMQGWIIINKLAHSLIYVRNSVFCLIVGMTFNWLSLNNIDSRWMV